MKIHFVCSGNSFRSRMAEAYLNSRTIPSVDVLSSGIYAKRNLNGPISWYAARVLKDKELILFMSNFWTQTTKDLIQKSDLIIFMEEEHYFFCKDLLSSGQKYEIWNIPDVIGADDLGLERDIENIKESDRIFELIRQKVDLLALR